jgi:hypothetical protein
VDIGQKLKLRYRNEDYGDILVDIRTDLHTCFLGVFTMSESGSGEHMTGDRQGKLTTKGMQSRIGRSKRLK